MEYILYHQKIVVKHALNHPTTKNKKKVLKKIVVKHALNHFTTIFFKRFKSICFLSNEMQQLEDQKFIYHK